MWIFSQSKGTITDPNGLVIYNAAYSGNNEGYNNPGYQSVLMVGPIPCGFYTIGSMVSHPKLGPYAMYLDPDPENHMFGRSGFYIHGDNASMNKTASDGCIIAPRTIREMIGNSNDKILQVVSGLD